MKKLVASVGLVALGTSGLRADAIPGTVQDQSKPWSAGLTLRGFYDSNPTTVENNRSPSWGFDVNPGISYIMRWEQTSVYAGFQYDFKYYFNKPPNQTYNYNQTYSFEVGLNHAFDPRYNIAVRDSYVIGQEPDVLRAGNSFSTFQVIPGNNSRNYALIDFNGQLSRELGFQVGWANTYYHYADDEGNFLAPSNEGLLGRLDNMVHLDSRWTLQPQTVGVVGYQFREVNYTAGQEIAITSNGTIVESDNRNFRENYFYLGADNTFSPNLYGSFRLGGRYVNYYNDVSGNNNGWGPYVMLNLQYVYAPKSYLEAGLSTDLNATDTVGANGAGNITLSTESTVLHGSINHAITQKLIGSIIGLFQYSVWQGGSLDGQNERYFLLGLNARYNFTPHLAAEAGYNYDIVASEDTVFNYNRNRVYLGFTAAY